MRIDALDIKDAGQLIADYKNNNETIMKFFDYSPFQSLETRLQELRNREFKRDELVEVLIDCNQEWGAGESSLQAIQKLSKPDSVVVVGGQQAGLLTGPLYTVNKVISIIQFAREQEEKLGIPVLPIFWIAGEDHDYEEINHVFLPQEKKLKKYKFNQSLYKKTPISKVSLDKELAKRWIDELFTTMPETIHTKAVYNMLIEASEQSETFTDFFARIIHKLFKDEGLILLDAADERIRKIESDYFIRLIETQPKISREVYEAAHKLRDNGYSPALDLQLTDGHLFYHQHGERILLRRKENGNWIGKQDEIELTTENLIETAIHEPEKLSNNVVTRPIMQELLLPTIAFIGGPGEISYWSLLKPAFHALDIHMPPVIPRLSFTYLPVEVKKALERTGMTLDAAIQRGSQLEKEAWLLTKQEPPIEELTQELKGVLETAHQPVREVADTIRADIAALAEKNLTHLYREIDYLQNRMQQALEEKYAKELGQFELIEMVLRPEGGLQERSWCVLPLINRHGTEIITKVTRASCSFQKQHYIVHL